MSDELFAGLLKWRCIGPFRGGRVVTVAGDCQNRNVYYFGACAGGVWKTVDGGLYWNNVSDGYFNTAAVGAIAVSESDPNVIYAGTGEATIRIDVSHGDGVYKSVDGGQSWTHCGLSDTRFIGKVRIHPTNPDIVYVAALGHAFGPNEERGVFKSTDGGQSWRKVLYKSDKAGAVDLVIDPTNPRILYASIWETYRNFWHMSSGGEDSGLYKSTDGGETWQEISANLGLPSGLWGKVGVTASPAKAGRVWALIENKDGGLFRSEDGGATWQRVSKKADLLSRAWYYTHVTADSQDANTVYVNNLKLWKSTDGGRTFDQLGTPHGDNHDIWIDPKDNGRLVQGNDGGANVSTNAGVTWTTIYNQPTGQIYRCETDNQIPYRVYGTQQDNSAISVPSRSHHGSITWADCYMPGTGESGWITPDPRDANLVYGGAIGSSPGGGNALQRYDHRTRQIRLVTTWPRGSRGYGDESLKYRFAWTYPILFSRHEPGKLWAAGNFLFQTTNEGQSWEIVSPDLSRNEAWQQVPSGGPINREPGGAETYNTIFSLAESHFEAGTLWAGTDDGLIHITRDGGQSWENVTPANMPEWTMIHCIEASPFAAGTAYVAGTRYKLDDYEPYLYKTADYGQSWQRINTGIAAHDFTRVIRTDPSREGLLYAGTETGLYLSFDDGESWSRFQLNLPVTPIYDLKVKEKDLVAATHGRAFWILDDLTPLHQYEARIAEKGLHLFAPRTTARVLPFISEERVHSGTGKSYMSTLGLLTVYETATDEEGVTERVYLDSGSNPPKGVIVTYHLAEAQPISLTIHDEAGSEIRSFRSRGADDDKKDGPFASAKAGWNRFVWDMRGRDAVKVEGDDSISQLTVAGAVVPPGRYEIRLTAGEQSESQAVDLVGDPRVAASEADLKVQSALWQQIVDKCGETAVSINEMRDVRAQLDGLHKRLGEHELAAEAKALAEQVLAIEETLAVPGQEPGWRDATNAGGRLLETLAGLPPVVYLGDFKPTDQAVAVFETLSAEIDAQQARFANLVAGELSAFNAKAAAVPTVIVRKG
ncbi:MAG: glycosyl hydrolase [Chloroflexota bacterium]